MGKIYTTSYVDPDIDGVACAVAYAELLEKSGQEAQAFVMGTPTVEAIYVMRRLGIVLEARERFSDNESVVLLDASEPIHFENRIPLASVVEVIDHRKAHNAEMFTNARVQIEFVGAAATLVAEKFLEREIQPSSSAAQFLQAAIVSNTQNFQANTTTERDHHMMKWLASIASLPADFIQDMFLSKSDMSGDKLFQNMDTETGIVDIAGKRFGVVQLEMIGTEALVENRLPEILGHLETLKGQNTLDHIVLTLLDIEKRCNRFVTADADMQSVLGQALAVAFVGPVAYRDGIIMRKEIIPLIKGVLV